MSLDSILEKRYYFSKNLGIPRFNKRINYYLFKLLYIQYNIKINKKKVNFNIFKYFFKNPNYLNF